MSAKAYRTAIAEFEEIRHEVVAAADALTRLAECLRDHPMRLKKTSGDLQAALHLEQLLTRFEEARERARTAYLEMPSTMRKDIEPPPPLTELARASDISVRSTCAGAGAITCRTRMADQSW